MGFFSIDGKFFRALTKAGDFFILGILAFVFSIPLVTIGPTFTAVYYVALKLVRDEEGYVFKSFIKAWKSNFKQAFIIELVIAILAILLVADVRICYIWMHSNGSTAAKLIMFAVFGFLLVLMAVSIYVFPVLAKFDNTVKETLKNALVLCMHHLPQTIVMLIINGGLIYFSMIYFTAFIVTIPLIFYVNSFILARIFQQYVNKENDNNNVTEADEWHIENEAVQNENIESHDTQVKSDEENINN